MDSIEIKKTVTAAIDHQQCGWDCEGGHVGIILVTIESRDQFGMTDGIADLPPKLGWEGGHPAHSHRGLNSIVQSRQVAGAQATNGQAHAPDPLPVDLRTRYQVIHRAKIVPEHHTCPGKSGSENGSADQWFALPGALIE